MARFIGSPGMNLVKGVWAGSHVLLPVNNRYTPAPQWQAALNRADALSGITIGFRPEDVLLQPDGPLSGTVISAGLHGSYTMLAIDLGDGQNLIEARVNRDTAVAAGDRVTFGLKPEHGALLRFEDRESHPTGMMPR